VVKHILILFVSTSLLATEADFSTVAAPTVYSEGHEILEGPATDAHGNLYVSDMRKAEIIRVDASGKSETFWKTGDGPNGLMVHPNGEIYACLNKPADGKSRVVAINPKTKAVRTVAAGYNGKPFNKCNDLVIDRSGGVYFTDFYFNAKRPLHQPSAGVYYAGADGTVTQIWAVNDRPNGITLSPDEKTLYLITSADRNLYAFPVLAPGRVGERRVHCQVQVPEGTTRGFGDGMSIDVSGNVYAAVQASQAIQVISPEGEILKLIGLPGSPLNCCFGGADNKTLFVTINGGKVVSVKLPVAGYLARQQK
jgi:gluconolactonase